VADDVQNITVEILKQIRDETRLSREDLGKRIDAVRTELSGRIDAVRVDLGARIDQTNARLDKVEETLVELATQNAFLVKHAKRSAARDRFMAREIEDLKSRVSDIESRLPPKEN
jgi:chromosome segregation ATPase